MEKTESLIEKFAKGVDALRDGMLDDKQGYILFAYNDVDKNGQENIFSSCGRFGNFAEMLFACMKSNPALANIMMAAVNAYAQNRMMESQINEAPVEQEASDKKKRRTKKLS
jgi:hypothetical protein